MNVFEFLDLPANHRPSSKVVQLVKNIEEVPASKRKYPMLGQVKKDGVFGMLVSTDTDVAIFGRTGKRLMSCEALINSYLHLPPGVYIGEVCLPGKSLEVLSGIVNPNRNKPVETDLSNYWLAFQEIHFHDHLTLEEFIRGSSTRIYSERLDVIDNANLPRLMYQPILSDADAEQYAKLVIEAGEEGAVFKRDVGYEAGHKGWRSMKRVRRIEYDLLCISVEEGKGKYAGKAANLIFQWRDGQTIKAMLGKSYTHEDAKGMFEAFHGDLGAAPGNPVGKIFRVYGLQDSSKGKIRLPKVGENRIDKDHPDF